MEILKFNMYLDGGTVEIITDEGIYCFDRRLSTTTRDKLYLGYPKKDNSNLIEDSVVLIVDLIKKLSYYQDDFYQESIRYFIRDICGIDEDEKFRQKYKEDHRYCPKCGSEKYTTTLIGFPIYSDNREAYKNLNKCVCVDCGDKHTAHERIGYKIVRFEHIQFNKPLDYIDIDLILGKDSRYKINKT